MTATAKLFEFTYTCDMIIMGYITRGSCIMEDEGKKAEYMLRIGNRGVDSLGSLELALQNNCSPEVVWRVKREMRRAVDILAPLVSGGGCILARTGDVVTHLDYRRGIVRPASVGLAYSPDIQFSATWIEPNYAISFPNVLYLPGGRPVRQLLVIQPDFYQTVIQCTDGPCFKSEPSGLTQDRDAYMRYHAPAKAFEGLVTKLLERLKVNFRGAFTCATFAHLYIAEQVRVTQWPD